MLAILLPPPELFGSPPPQANEKSKLPSLVMVIGVVVDRVAVPPERDKTTSETSNLTQKWCQRHFLQKLY